MRFSVERQSRIGIGQGCTSRLLQPAPTVPLAAAALNKNNEFQCFFDVRDDLGQGTTAIKLIFSNFSFVQHAYAHIFTCPHLSLFTYRYIYMYRYICIYIYMCVNIYIYMFTCIYICKHKYIYIYLAIYININIYKYICKYM